MVSQRAQKRVPGLTWESRADSTQVMLCEGGPGKGWQFQDWCKVNVFSYGEQTIWGSLPFLSGDLGREIMLGEEVRETGRAFQEGRTYALGSGEQGLCS